MENINTVMKNSKKLKICEKDRVDSFKSWPYGNNSLCSIQKMAEAGFYWTGNERENDTATCFACGKVLDGWEASDDPWLEHKKHAPQCYFVKLGKPENKLTITDFIDLYLNVVLFSIKMDKKFHEKKMKMQADKIRDKFIATF